MKNNIFVIRKDMQLKNITNRVIIIVLSLNILTFTLGFFSKESINLTQINKMEDRLIILKANEIQNKFTPQLYRDYIVSLNIKYPWIAYSQSLIESTHFTSQLFKNNHNLIGMKRATERATKNVGEELNHADFLTWKDCVDDYALFYNRYQLCKLTEKEYLEFLRLNYAEDGRYIDLLKKIIPTVKHLFMTNSKDMAVGTEIEKEIDEYYRQANK